MRKRKCLAKEREPYSARGHFLFVISLLEVIFRLLRSSLKSSSVNLTYTLLQFVDIPKQNEAYLNVKLNFQVNHQLIAKIDKCWKGSQPH